MFGFQVMLACIVFSTSFVSVLARNIRLDSCPVDVCTCKDNTAVCKNNGHILDYIPQFPLNIDIVDFSGNNLQFITSDTFYNLSALRITRLSLANSRIRYISNDAFSKLHSLSFLDLTSNIPLVHSILRKSFSSLKFSGSGSLVLNRMNIVEKDMHNLFQHLEKTNVTEISLEYNNLLHIDSCFFGEFQNLQILKISNNDLREITFNCLTAIRHLEINGNNLEMVPKLCLPSNTTAMPRLEELSITHNAIRILNSNSFSCCERLRILKLTNNPFLFIGQNSFHHFQRLRYLEVSSLYKYNTYSLQNASFSSSCIEHISLRNFSFIGAHISAFHGHFPCSVTLDLSYNVLPSDNHTLGVLFEHLYSLTNLKARSVTWTKIPYSLFSNMHNLKSLDISYNNFQSFDPNVFISYSVEFLDISHSKVLIVNSVTSSLSSLRVLDLSNNTFDCSCNNTKSFLTFFQKLRNQNVSIRYYPESYVCTNPKEFKGKTINKVVCRPNVDTVFYIILLTVFMCVVSSTIAFKSRYHIRYWIHILTKPRKNKWRKMEKPQVYDAFVIYFEEDRKWLFSHFLPFIEGQNGYKLCIHSRDFKYGRLIVDNIVENMNKSRKIVLIISENFVNSRWCMFEVLLAHERFLQNGPDSLVSIKLEEISSISMTNTLESLIKFATHAVWTADDHNREEFWVKILDCLQTGNTESQKTDNVVNDDSIEDLPQEKNRSNGKQNEHISSEEESNKDEIKRMLSDICFQMNNMSDTIYRRIDNFEESVRKDISSLTEKVHEIEAKLMLFQNDRPVCI